MFKLIRILLLIMTCLLLSFSSAIAQSSAVKLVRTKGSVEVKNTVNKSFKAIKPVTILNSGDTIRTLESAKAQITFPIETVVILGEKSLLSLNFIDNNGAGKLNLKNGSFLADLKKALQAGSTFEIKTRDALAVVRGTILQGNIGEKSTTFRGYKGKVLLYSRKKANLPPIELLPGMKVEIDLDGNMTTTDNDLTLEQALSQFDITDNEAEKEEPETNSTDLTLPEDKDQTDESNESKDDISRKNALDDKTTAETLQDIEKNQTQSDNEARLRIIYKDLLSARGFFDKAIDRNDKSGALNIFLGLKSRFDEVEKYKQSINYSPTTNKSKLLSDIIELIQYFKLKAGLLVNNPDQALDENPGSIDNLDSNPSQKPGGIDTDQDGIDDATEILINTNPNVSNRDSGFFITQMPTNNSQLYLELDNPILFRAKPIITNQTVEYELIVRGKNPQPLFTLRQNSPNFEWDASKAFTEERNELTWFVNAYLPERQNPDLPIPSRTNKMVVWKDLGPTRPPSQGTLTLEGNLGNANPTNGESGYELDVLYSNFLSIKAIQLNLEYDPTILEFVRVVGIGHFANAVVFSGGAENTGKLNISSQKPDNTNYNVAEAGALFKVYFRVKNKGSTPISIKNPVVTGANDLTVNPQTDTETLIIN